MHYPPRGSGSVGVRMCMRACINHLAEAGGVGVRLVERGAQLRRLAASVRQLRRQPADLRLQRLLALLD